MLGGIMEGGTVSGHVIKTKRHRNKINFLLHRIPRVTERQEGGWFRGYLTLYYLYLVD